MAAALLPCFRSAASIYLSPEVIWRYLMTTILFWPEKFRRQYRRSPRLSIVAAPVHLVFEFAMRSTALKRTAYRRRLPMRLAPRKFEILPIASKGEISCVQDLLLSCSSV